MAWYKCVCVFLFFKFRVLGMRIRCFKIWTQFQAQLNSFVNVPNLEIGLGLGQAKPAQNRALVRKELEITSCVLLQLPSSFRGSNCLRSSTQLSGVVLLDLHFRFVYSPSLLYLFAPLIKLSSFFSSKSVSLTFLFLASLFGCREN